MEKRGAAFSTWPASHHPSSPCSRGFNQGKMGVLSAFEIPVLFLFCSFLFSVDVWLKEADQKKRSREEDKEKKREEKETERAKRQFSCPCIVALI